MQAITFSPKILESLHTIIQLQPCIAIFPTVSLKAKFMHAWDQSFWSEVSKHNLSMTYSQLQLYIITMEPTVTCNHASYNYATIRLIVSQRQLTLNADNGVCCCTSVQATHFAYVAYTCVFDYIIALSAQKFSRCACACMAFAYCMHGKVTACAHG